MKCNAGLIAVLFAVPSSFTVAGCSKKEPAARPSVTGGSNKATATTSLSAVTLNASGSTFQQAFQEVAIESFTKSNSNIKLNYGGGGSGKGRQDFADAVTDFGCTDASYKDEEKAKLKGGEFVYVPVLLGAITVSYNLEGIAKLQLSADTIAKIFQRDIKKWNDPAIAADNAGVTLPDTDIVVAHRSDGSGTTQQFTLYLTLAAATTWKLKSSSTAEWPADTQAGNGNGGVAQIIKSTKGAIGYVDLPDAKASGLTYASIKNAAGKFVAPSPAGMTAAAAAVAAGLPATTDYRLSIVNAAGADAYPISSFTWILVYQQQADAAKGKKLVDFLRWALTEGEAQATALDYAPLPTGMVTQILTRLDSIKSGTTQ